MTKSLKEKAIKIKGNDYVLVSDRIIYFNETYKNGCIHTKLLSEPQADMVVVQAKIIPNMETPERYFSGLSQAKWGEGMVNKTSALENAETSAVGRALAMMGIGVIDSIASADEMSKAGVKEFDVADNAICPIHKVKLIHWEKEGREGWYHKTKDGGFCNGRNTKYNREK